MSNNQNMPDEKSSKIQSAIIGNAGEHLAISYLLRKNMIAGLAPQNTEDFDIVVMSKNGTTLFPVQVKTSTKKNWMLSKKHESPIKNLIYIFIRFSSDLMESEMFMMTSKKVSEVTSISHQIWLKLPNKDGGPHKDSDIRNLMIDTSQLIKKVERPDQYLTEDEIKFIENHSMGWLEQYRNDWTLFQTK